MPSIIIPANNEGATIGACLDGIAEQTFSGSVEVIVSANGCSDDTVAVAESRRLPLSRRGYDLVLIDRPEPGKIAALNAADQAATHAIRIYLDADVICTPTLLTELAEALNTDTARYASGTLTLAPTKSWITRKFGQTWINLPFIRTTVPGAGLFSVNAAGRARWETFPDIIADDLYIRLLFTPEERVAVPSRYYWPLTEGFRALVRVRRRQDAGVAEIAEKYPDLLQNESKVALKLRDHLRLFLVRPISYAVYVGIKLIVRFGPDRHSKEWARSR